MACCHFLQVHPQQLQEVLCRMQAADCIIYAEHVLIRHAMLAASVTKLFQMILLVTVSNSIDAWWQSFSVRGEIESVCRSS